MNRELLISGLSALGIEPEEERLCRFADYSALLKEWNQKMNLTAVCDDDGISVKHFLDSVLPLASVELPQNAAVLDLGTGAGFPGIPVKILRPDLRLTLMDALQKRIRFLQEVCDKLGFADVALVHGRAEDCGKQAIYREQFDCVLSRAVANMTVLCEYCLPFVKVGGMFLALKSESAEEEVTVAKPMIGNLGGTVEDIISAPLPESDILRKIVVVRKTSPTPKQFPRRANKIKK